MSNRDSERGNIFIVIFLAIVLIGLLTIAIRGTGSGKTNINDEDLKIQAAQVMRYGTELENAVAQVLQNGASENDIRFANPADPTNYGNITTTPQFQVFSQSGGRATYRMAPSKVLVSGMGDWEFYGTTDMPQVGSDKPELIAVLPDITPEFCKAINKELGLTGQPNDNATGSTPDCVQGGGSDRFGTAFFSTVPNRLDPASFSKLPMTQACVACGANYHYVHVLMAR